MDVDEDALIAIFQTYSVDNCNEDINYSNLASWINFLKDKKLLLIVGEGHHGVNEARGFDDWEQVFSLSKNYGDVIVVYALPTLRRIYP